MKNVEFFELILNVETFKLKLYFVVELAFILKGKKMKSAHFLVKYRIKCSTCSVIFSYQKILSLNGPLTDRNVYDNIIMCHLLC